MSPDPDLVTFWLADRIDERGWGLAGDTFHVMDGLRATSASTCGSTSATEDLAIGIERARRLRAGERLTDAHAAIAKALGAPGRVLPMSDAPVRTRVHGANRPLVAVSGVHDQGRRRRVRSRTSSSTAPSNARPDPGGRSRRIATAAGDRDRTVQPGDLDRPDPRRSPASAPRSTSSPAPVVAVSPLVAGEVVKGPTAAFMELSGPAAAQRRDRRALRGDDRRPRRRRANRARAGARDRRADGPADARRRVAEERSLRTGLRRPEPLRRLALGYQ